MDDSTKIWMKSGDKPIILNPSSGSATYYMTTKYQSHQLNQAYTWHLIHVHHRGLYSPAQVLDGIFNVVGDNEFYPVAYRETSTKDSFLVRQCKPAIQKLFQSSLTIAMPGGDVMMLTVVLNAAEYTTGQIFPKKIVERIVKKQFKQLVTTDKQSQVLILEQFSNHPETSDIVIRLSSRPALQLLCEVIVQNHNILNTINGLNLSKNGIKDLTPFKEFANSSLKMLDLRHNNIEQTSQFQLLKCLEIDELYVIGNPCTSGVSSGYFYEIKALLPHLKSLDGVSTGDIKESTTDTIEMMYPGDVIRDARDRALFPQYKKGEMWCQVVVEHQSQQISRSEILKALFEMVALDVSDFYPCYYKAARIEDVFFVRKSYEHLESLLDNGLALHVPNHSEIPLTLKMNVSDFKKGQIEPEEQILKALAARFNIMDRCLNLENFSKSPEFKNVIVSLSNNRTLSTVLTLSSRRFLTNLVHLRLGSNKIASLKGIRCLNNAKSVKIIDLSNNLIEDISELSVIKLPLTELILDGNPLCRKYPAANQYVKEIKTIFPTITKLDGCASLKHGSMAAERNFLCSKEAYGFVDQFVNDYFSLYDSPLRYKLVGMYHDKAMISISYNYNPAKVSNDVMNRTSKYTFIARNILAANAPQPQIQYGRAAVEQVLKYLPVSEHDLCSFTTDVTIFTDDLVSLTITGVFQEPGDIMNCDIRFSFSRIFLFQKYASELGIFKNTCEYKIINDILYITHPTADQSKNLFRFSKHDKKPEEPPTVEDKENFLVMFQRMTGLKTIWCTRCFTDANGDFQKAVEVFINLVKINKIPENAFVKNCQIP